MTQTSLSAGLILIHGNHPESLRDLLVEWMKGYPLSPLENEIILVQSNGIAQWLKLALAADIGTGIGKGGCGIAAALEFSLPSSFLWNVYRQVMGRDAVPETSPFDKSRLIWRLMRLLPAVMALPEYFPLQRFLENDNDRRKRFQLAERLADLYDQYQVYRSDWLSAWSKGDDELIDARGHHIPLDTEHRWQAALWRALLVDVSSAAQHKADKSNAGRAAVHEAFLHRAQNWPAGERPTGLPRRVMVFGISSLPRQSLEVLAELARWTQVLMCIHNPCEHYWADIVADKDLLRGDRSRQSRRPGRPSSLSEEILHLHAHPLLAAWGKQGRDFIGLLDEHDSGDARAFHLPQLAALQQRTDVFAAHGDSTLLLQLQDDIRDLRPLGETRARWPAVDPETDRSIQFHLAHSSQREVEVLHDQLLAAFDADKTLKPRDIIVMVPDIDTYAPHIQAVFNQIDVHDQRYIPYSIADRGQRHFDPLINALETLLGLPQSRVAVSDLLDLLEVPALRDRFKISEEDLPQLHRWISGANIRWGLHAEQRHRLGLPEESDQAAQNTWLFGLRRMLLGYAVGADAGAWNEIEPYGEIGGLDAALLGPLSQLIDRLESTWRNLREPAPVNVWGVRLRTLLTDFFVSDDTGNAYTLLQLETALRRWQEACSEAVLTEALPLSVVADYWLSQIDEGALSQRFFAGAVTFATLMPMRAIPFRHVCLLGMNDGDYPRSRTPMDFDLMYRDYRPGDRSRREDDRYLFLEAVLSARDVLHISWVGRSINDNTARPPSVLVGQLRDHLAAGWRLAGVEEVCDATGNAGAKLLAALTLEHKLQPFSLDYFPPQAKTSRFFTYAWEWRSADRVTPVESTPTVSELLPLLPRDEPITIEALGSFLKAPVKAFFQQRLNVTFLTDNPAEEDQEPFSLEPLGKWALQNELLQVQVKALEQGEDRAASCDTQLARIQRRGELAAGGFGQVMAQTLVEPMERLFESYQAALDRWPLAQAGEESVQFTAVIGDQELVIVDWLGGIRTNAEGQRARVLLETSDLVVGKSYRGDKVIRHWVSHLAGHLAGKSLTTEIVSKVGEITLEPLEIGDAQAHMVALLRAWQLGMRKPLPLAPKTAFSWLAEGNEAKARTTYVGAYKNKGEVENCVYLQRGYPDFDALIAGGEFFELAETLLGPVYRALPAKTGKRSNSSDTTSAGASE